MSIESVVMPKWGLTMEEGTLTSWNVAEGQIVVKGQSLAEIESTKIASAFESPASGTVRRLVAHEGQILPIGALIAVVSDESVSDEDVASFVDAFMENFKVADKATSDGPKPRTIEARGFTIRTLAVGEGDGTPILLIHGFGADLTSWLFTQEPLARSRIVHAFDLPGHGGSSKAIVNGSVDDLALTTLAVMDTLGLARVHLVGHSLGGAIAAKLALSQPHRVASATLIAPAGLGSEINAAFIEGFITENRARKLRVVLQQLVFNAELITADMVEDVLKFKRLDGAEKAIRAIAEANFLGGRQTTILKDELANAIIPLAVVVGEEDKIIPAAYASDLPAAIAVTLLASTGHLPHMEKSAVVNDIISGNIAKAV